MSMASLWFDEPERDHTFDPFDPVAKPKPKEVKNRFKEESLMPSRRADEFRNKKDDDDDPKSDYSSICGPLKVERNRSIIPMNHPRSLLHPDEPEKERRKRSRSRSLTPGAEAYQALSLNNAPAANEAQDEDIEAEIEQLTRKKSKKRKAIVKGSSVVEFGKAANSGASFLGVGLMSDVKSRTLSPTTRRKKSTRKSKKSKSGAYAVIAANFDSSEAFSKPREPKRIDSVTGDSDDEEKEEDAQPKTSSNKKQNLDKLPPKVIAEMIGVSFTTFKRMKTVTGYTHTQLVASHKQFHTTFHNGVVTKKEFSALAKDVTSNKWDANMFTENVFKMFDLNGDEALTFEEFIFATSAQNFDNVHDKLGWLFDNVYDRDKDGRINRKEIKDILNQLLIMEGFEKEKAYWLVEECFKKIHDKEMEQLEQSPYIPLQQEREIDGKMDKKKFLQYVKNSKLISGLLASKSDLVRKSKLESDIKKVDVRNLEIRALKPAKNSNREVLMTKTRRSVRRSRQDNPEQQIGRSRSASRMDVDDDVFSTRSARIQENVIRDRMSLKYCLEQENLDSWTWYRLCFRAIKDSAFRSIGNNVKEEEMSFMQ